MRSVSGICDQLKESPALLSPAKVCGWCLKEMAPGALPASHGICPTCRIFFWPDSMPPALMAPATTRWECNRCDHVTLDDDGVAEGCVKANCIRKDRRDPWFLVSLHNRLLKRRNS